jgi:starvation-inducible DNA-binding protein
MVNRTRIGITRDQQEALVEVLNACLASTVDLGLQVKHAHWNVKGHVFYGWHLLFDQLAENLHQQADRIAERAAALGGVARGTARHVVEGTYLAGYEIDDADGHEHVAALAERFGAHAAALRGAIGRVAAAPLAEKVTENLLVDVLQQVEMDLWFLDAHLGERPERVEMAPPPQPPLYTT